MNKKQILRRIKHFRKSLRDVTDPGLWIDFPLDYLHLKVPSTEAFLVENYNCYFSNGLCGHRVRKLTLVYCSYEGVVGIVPDKMEEHHSYMEPNAVVDTKDPEEWFNAVWQMWEYLRIDHGPKEVSRPRKEASCSES